VRTGKQRWLPKSTEETPIEIEALPRRVVLVDDEKASQHPIMDIDWLCSAIDEGDRGSL
jgi:hypothetical protein